jgi:ubiquinone/menaquinone biosynthesis C-methylase UbiE
MTDQLPQYAERMDTLHEALADDFDAIVGQVALAGGELVVDAGCGNGFFTQLLARRITSGQVIGLDFSAAFLHAARGRLRDLISSKRVRLVEGDVNRLPFDSASLDVVWSAHSMQSYDDLPAVLAEFRRVLRPGGMIAALESDAMHSMMLPWPPRLELAVRQAERRALADADDRLGAYFPRYASRLLREAGFYDFTKRHTLVYRHGPLDGQLLRYARLYLQDLVARTREHLAEPLAGAAEKLAASYASATAEEDADLYFGSLQVLMTAQAGPKEET